MRQESKRDIPPPPFFFLVEAGIEDMFIYFLLMLWKYLMLNLGKSVRGLDLNVFSRQTFRGLFIFLQMWILSDGFCLNFK